MPDQRFFTLSGSLTLNQLASLSKAELVRAVNPDALISGAAALDTASNADVSVVRANRDVEHFRTSQAGACFVRPEHMKEAPLGMALLLTPTPYKAFALSVRSLYPNPDPNASISPRAVVDPTAQVGEGTEIQPGAVVGAGAQVGRNCRIEANVVIGSNVVLGGGTSVGAGAYLSHCLVGRRVSILPGACIGQEGFDFANDEGKHLRVPQLGRVLIGDDVEIGANTTIDRGALRDTIVGNGSVIDNLVHIGHEVEIGPRCTIIAQVGIAGDTKLGEGVILGGQVGIVASLLIGAGARIGGQSGVTRNVPPGAEFLGSPALPKREFCRQASRLKRLGASSRL